MSTFNEHGISRCAWCAATPKYREYHDQEWGYPEADETKLFEKLCLETFQSGLSWLTILNKRSGFRLAFDEFNPKLVAKYSSTKVEALMQDAQIVRNRAKINATINNATKLLQMHASGERLSSLLWSFAPKPESDFVVQAQSAESRAMAKALKLRGFVWVGPVTCYSLMQACGMVNDHDPACDSRALVQASRKQFKLP